MIGNYWNIKALSNSELTALARAVNALPDNRAELEDVFNFGSLVDAMLTESWKVNRIERTLLQDDGFYLEYSAALFDQAVRLVEYCRKDPVISMIVKHMIGQYIFVRSMQIDFKGYSCVVKCKCKFDAYSKLLRMGADYKTTSCTTEKQFIEAIDFFHWDRQGAFYMDLGKIDKHWIIGISKPTGKIFKYAIERGGEAYERGKNKYCKWATRYDMLGLDAFADYTTKQNLILA